MSQTCTHSFNEAPELLIYSYMHGRSPQHTQCYPDVGDDEGEHVASLPVLLTTSQAPVTHERAHLQLVATSQRTPVCVQLTVRQP